MSTENKLDKIEVMDKDVLTDIKYLCKSNTLITESLRNGCDVTQLRNGDIIVTEVKVVNVQYSWDAVKNKMVRLGNSPSKK